MNLSLFESTKICFLFFTEKGKKEGVTPPKKVLKPGNFFEMRCQFTISKTGNECFSKCEIRGSSARERVMIFFLARFIDS